MKNKEIVLSLLIIGFGVLSGWAWEKILKEPYWAFVILLYAVSFGFFLLIVRNQWSRWFVPPISLVGFSALKLFYGQSEFALYGLAAAALFIILATWEASVELDSSVKLSMKRVLSASLRLFFTSLALIAAFSYYADIKDKPDSFSSLLPEQVVVRKLQI